MTADVLRDADARLRGRDAAGAKGLLDALLARTDIGTPMRVEALRLRASAHEAQGHLQAAMADLIEALQRAPGDARAWNALGLLHADTGASEAAASDFARATELDPGYARAWNNLGNAHRAQGDAAAAERAFARAAEVDPRYALAFANLGAVRRERGDERGADAALQRAIGIDPNQRVALLALAGLRRQQGRLDEAGTLYARATDVDPRDPTPFLLRAQTLAERDGHEEARAAYDAALARDPGLLRAAFGRHLSLPMVPAGIDEVAAARDCFEHGLALLEQTLPARAARLASERLVDELRWTNFLLAYQGRDDHALQSRYGDLLARLIGERASRYAGPLPHRPAGTRVRVAFVSAFLRDGTAGRYFERWITDLSRDRFDVTVYHLNAVSDALTARIAARADSFHAFARLRPSQIAPVIVAGAHDVIVYPELGMDATAFALAALRLAPVQCAAWGHPVTTGLRTIDVYFSSGAMEPVAGEAHYRERLHRLPGLGTRYAMPVVPPDADRARLGLPDGAPLLSCPQSLFKIHPANDALFARVLAAAPLARLVLFEGRHPALTAAYLARLERALAAHGMGRSGRIHVLPQCSHDDYLRVNAVCDAMLDTVGWSGGNTSLDALACALPIVTLPGATMRARQSAGMLRTIGVGATIAADEDDYVRLSARLADDRPWRHDIAASIASARGALFDDRAPIAALADALEALART